MPGRPTSRLLALLVLAVAAGSLRCVHGRNESSRPEPELVAPGVISTGASEVRLAVSPDGALRIWGSIGRDGGTGGLDLWQSRRGADGTSWGAAVPASVNSTANDFDPSFSPDGTALYFFSNREGGLGGDDLYAAPYDARSQTLGAPVNLGPGVNTARDEWAPCLSPDGKTLLFASDGRGGAGKHDLFTATRGADGAWGAATGLPGALNSAVDDYDATFLGSPNRLVFTREVPGKNPDDSTSMLMLSSLEHGAWTAPRALDINIPGELNFGPSVSAGEPGFLYFTSRRPGNGKGRMDLYRVRME